MPESFENHGGLPLENARIAHEDLRFIKNAVAQHRHGRGGAPEIYLVWGVLTMVGYPLLDWRPEYEGLYWMVAGPAGGLASWLLGRRYSRLVGEDGRAEGKKWILHWLVVTAAMALLPFMIMSGQLRLDGVGPMILLVVSLSLGLAAVHGESRLGWNALIMAAGYVALFFIHQYVWTMIGVTFFLGSLLNYIMARRAHE